MFFSPYFSLSCQSNKFFHHKFSISKITTRMIKIDNTFWEKKFVSFFYFRFTRMKNSITFNLGDEWKEIRGRKQWIMKIESTWDPTSGEKFLPSSSSVKLFCDKVKIFLTKYDGILKNKFYKDVNFQSIKRLKQVAKKK